MIDLNTLYSRYDPGATATGAYYGYTVQNSISSQNTSDTSYVFSLKKVFSIGNVQYTQWANNTINTYESDWANRASWFATPSNITVTGTSSFNGSYTTVTFNWTGATGCSRYIANITNQLGQAITYLPDISHRLNPNHNSTSLQFVNQLSCTLQNVIVGNTYSISIYPSNGYGSASTVSASVAV